jgi:hypothetical protein
MASHKSEERSDGWSSASPALAQLLRNGANEVASRLAAATAGLDLEADDAGVTEINWLFGQKIAGLRRLPRHARSHALRAAKNEKQAALKALRERRADRRRAEYALRKRQSEPAPR